MRPISAAMRADMAADPYYERCARQNGQCSGRITWEHVWIYAGKQINEKWAIIPLCWFHHLGAGLDKVVNQWLSLKRTTLEDLKKYPNKDWPQIIKYLMYKFHWQGIT